MWEGGSASAGRAARLSFLVCGMHKEGADKPGVPRCSSHPVSVRLTASEVWPTPRARRARLRGMGGGRGKGGEEGPREAGGRQPSPLLL